MDKRYIFGPINSRRFGISLGIDLSVDFKSCNFDCLYCELSVAKVVDHIINPPKVRDVIEQLKEELQKQEQIDVITITANGEPTLYKDLKELVKEINLIKEDKKLLILSNASTISLQEVQEALMDIDIVKLSLDCATNDCFRKLDRAKESISLDSIIQGMREFSSKYKGDLVVEILVVKGINDNIEQMKELDNVLKEIKPSRVDLGTVDRPPAYSVEGVTQAKLEELREAFTNLPVHIITKTPPKNKIDFTKEKLLETIALRPQSEDDVANLFSEKSKMILKELIDEKKVIIVNIAGVVFYMIADHKQKRKG